MDILFAKRKLKEFLLKISLIKYYAKGRSIFHDRSFLDIQKINNREGQKRPKRNEVINFLLSLNDLETYYLEIGVRNPDHNFNHINATKKYSVDPGVEYELNPVDFRMTSDVFFDKMSKSEILSNNIKFDVIFIDGLHLAEQVNRDIINSLRFVKDDGFIVLHDCNPPTEWHARECFRYWHTPAQHHWNGTTWKAFYEWRCNPLVNSCCIDSDWGIGILSKQKQIGKHTAFENPFFEFSTLNKNRKENLNLMDFETFKKNLTK